MFIHQASASENKEHQNVLEFQSAENFYSTYKKTTQTAQSIHFTRTYAIPMETDGLRSSCRK